LRKSGLFSSYGTRTLIYLEFGYDHQTTTKDHQGCHKIFEVSMIWWSILDK
jgi:hypothetical protein